MERNNLKENVLSSSNYKQKQAEFDNSSLNGISKSNEITLKTEDENSLNSNLLPTQFEASASISKPQIDNSCSSKIFVGGLSKFTTNEQLNKYFHQYSAVKESIIIKSNEKSVKSRGFGFVIFVDAEIIDDLLKMEHIIDGCKVEIRKAVPKENISEETPKQKLFIGGLPKSITIDEFREYFQKYGELLESNLIVDKNGRSKGYGFITYKDDITLNDTNIINGKTVDIRIAHSKKTNIKSTDSTVQLSNSTDSMVIKNDKNMNQGYKKHINNNDSSTKNTSVNDQSTIVKKILVDDQNDKKSDNLTLSNTGALENESFPIQQQQGVYQNIPQYQHPQQYYPMMVPVYYPYYSSPPSTTTSTTSTINKDPQVVEQMKYYPHTIPHQQNQYIYSHSISYCPPEHHQQQQQPMEYLLPQLSHVPNLQYVHNNDNYQSNPMPNYPSSIYLPTAPYGHQDYFQSQHHQHYHKSRNPLQIHAKQSQRKQPPNYNQPK